ncbi:tRNA (adenosine(37)-N6)-threonylcarbamoyltransferase complex dimerization subunit type 1 TsaB [Paenibacillus tianjinensis]|uniref:tRNA (Adenosine(37)-N6)-threonylcarbamoyltransferase complex dimerization subunit type 1 TsaB n=1 Tax=Paenibacillus tianjinensis TaxID=2810347 RepID=A0ABX7LD47_9BACL|nr:tRNA (adenosine(37)-N6)-threonylcarbamoyltransferase complex dimerization subunit type 1 TsaB [Paenibacillus tianjinensis]QSF45861.1 tRNA (adenosine(37)-N6)-threonylcarbamoyltransferase complex dimerization subunit type 1 TsaB [Paenibacillus tianjinensis]
MMNENNGPRKRLLALDTSTAVLGVAVTEDGRLLHEINASGERNHSVHLLPIIEQALQASGTEASMLGGVAVGLGPGSYTGTRIAVTAAKTLAWAWKVPVVGISSLHALAWGGYAAIQEKQAAAAAEQAARTEGFGPDWIIPLLDARRGQVYTGLFTSCGLRAPQRLEPDAIRLMADWVMYLSDRLKQAEAEGSRPRSVWFVGETALHGSGDSLRPLLGAADVHAEPYELEGRWAALLGEERLLEGSGGDDIHGLIPNYTQLTEAEANLRRSSEGSASKV